MSKGMTRKMDRAESTSAREFLCRNRASLVILSGDSAGAERSLDRPEVTLGRGPGVDLCFEDDALSRQHAAIELGSDGYRIRDLGSTNGITVNGSPTLAADLKHGDRIEIGGLVLQYLVEKDSSAQRTYLLPEE